MRKIKLTQGKFALVDDKDYAILSKNSWYLSHDGYAVKGNPYSRMHRLILDTPKGSDTDHINKNKLDNRRKNLRVATRGQNMANIDPTKANKSGVKGVFKHSLVNMWQAQICFNYKTIYLGLFENFEDAVKARKKAEIKYFKEFA